MTTLIADGHMTSDLTAHTAQAVNPSRPYSDWTVTWLPGRTLTYNQAITAMTVAELAGMEPETGDPMWAHLDQLARELGLAGGVAACRLVDVTMSVIDTTG